jgi:hypothetical protein
MRRFPSEAEKNIGSTNVHTAANKSFVLTDLSSFDSSEFDSFLSHAGLYQQIAFRLIRTFNTNRNLNDLVTKLASLANHAYTFRRFEAIGWVGEVLLSLASSNQMASLGHYYTALSLNRGTRGDRAQATPLFEQVAEKGPLHYRARALLALGANSLVGHDGKAAAGFYSELMRILPNNREYVMLFAVMRMTATMKGMEGDHRGALEDLERLFPLVRLAGSEQPHVFYDYQNSLAVELAKVGRLEEARHASEIALASPFAKAYPEWRDTRDGIERRERRPSRAAVSLTRYVASADNLLYLPVSGHACSSESGAPPTNPAAPVLNLMSWKKKMTEATDAVSQNKKDYKDMDGRELLLKIMELTAATDLTDEELREIVEMIEGILSRPKDLNQQ